MTEQDATAALEAIRSADPRHGDRSLAIVLGSGWGPVVDALMDVQGTLSYGEIPGFPLSTVEGHAGQLTWGTMAGVPLYCMQGRFHYYEGYSMREITFPMRVFAALGLKGVLLTNAAGGISGDFHPGSLMLVTDHINFMGDHPLRGPNADALGPRFPDMTEAYDKRLQACFREASRAAAVPLHEGVYLAVSGPSFETPAEIRAFARLGADAVGMSTVPECLVARHAGMRVAGLSCITNLAAHTGGAPLTHEEVAAAARESLENVKLLLANVLPLIHAELTA